MYRKNQGLYHLNFEGFVRTAEKEKRKHGIVILSKSKGKTKFPITHVCVYTRKYKSWKGYKISNLGEKRSLWSFKHSYARTERDKIFSWFAYWTIFFSVS